MGVTFHEDLARPEETPSASDRVFGLVFAVVFTIVGLWPLIRGSSPRWWAIGIAGGFSVVAIVRADLLRPLKQRWARVALVIDGVISFVVMSVIFYLVISPMALVMRLLGRDVLRRRLDPSAKTYWIQREPSAESADMRRQF